MSISAINVDTNDRRQLTKFADHSHGPPRRRFWATLTRPSRRMAAAWHSPGR